MANYHTALKERHRAERDNQSINLSLRLHRALSWLKRAEQEEDADSRFIFMWIAFNAAYATDIDSRQGLTEQGSFNAFIEKLAELDSQKQLAKLLWESYSSAIRVLLDNEYIFAPFWEYQKGNKTEAEWQDDFKRAKQASHAAFANQDTATVLGIVLSRIYVLRNQLVHGGATWQSQLNRDQIRDCNAFMGELVPLIIKLMMDHPNTLWGDASYPPLKN